MTSRAWTLVAVVLASGIVFLDSTVVNVALERMGRELPSTLVGRYEGQSYVTNGYLLTLSALLILAGSLADTFGRRRLFLIGLAGFGVASVACGLAPSMEVLVLARLVQGAFGALLVPTSLALITAAFSGPERGRAFGVWAAASSATTLVGPLVGGFLVDTVSWRVAFLMNAPLVVAGLVIGGRFIAESRDPDARRLDWVGAFVVAVAVGGLSFGLTRGQERSWADALAWASLGAGIVATVALVPLMRMRRDPLVPPSLFASRNFTVTNVSTLLVYGALYVQLFIQAIFLQGTLGYSALAAGLAGLPTFLLLTLFSTSIGAWAGRAGPRWFMAVGPAVMALGLAWYLRLPVESAAWPAALTEPGTLLPPPGYLVDVLPANLLFGIGIALLVAPLTTALMSSIPERNAGLASAINNAVSRIGPLVAGALIFVAVTGTFYGVVGDRVPGTDVTDPAVRRTLTPLNPPGPGATAEEAAAARIGSVEAFRVAMLLAALLCVAGAAVNAAGIRNPRDEGSRLHAGDESLG
ncbi:MAG TPA: MFS transporter [Candidatus Limnocylindria bacterium]|nr:MFS transporter [Candidatus Limnocylindria bacterium]